ncbi:hypothetical protein [uncultured Bartonella sp.]|uniref:hypothetical protein n=1 Tax=uncultured Bartonella sp. TaxID=104108 RepID=UPI0025E4DB9A|nr:hypothetical protein [uncultured Bartonella sp.]
MIIDFFTRKILDEADIKPKTLNEKLNVTPYRLMIGFVDHFRANGYSDDRITMLANFALKTAMKRHNAN